MIFRCIEDFEVPWVDEDWGYPTENIGFVTCDSLWELEDNGNYTLTGAEVRLNSIDDETDFSWIEISKDRLKNNFEIEEE